MARLFWLGLLAPAFLISGCAEDPDLRTYDDVAVVESVFAITETTPVPSLDDAADDPVVWVNESDVTQSRIVGTDKQSGLIVYDLEGKQLQHLADGLPNNVDLRANISIPGFDGALVVTSDRADNTLGLYSMSAEGLTRLGSIASPVEEPYGACMGHLFGLPTGFVTYKTGEVIAYRIESIASEVNASVVKVAQFETQLEGCTVDDERGVLYVGEENRGFWALELTEVDQRLSGSDPVLLDGLEQDSGLVADVEGLDLYIGADGERYLVVSSQGNDSFAVYAVEGDGFEVDFVKRFRVSAQTSGIDGAQETDGIAVSSANLGSRYPEGILVVQDGFNAPQGSAQNFKYVDWRSLQVDSD